MTKYLYRKGRHGVTLVCALAAGLALLSSGISAQWRAPQPERTTARAIGVLESYPNGTRRLIPIALVYQRRYYDANFYRAAPVPLALDSETVYEVEHFGKPLGTFTVQSATRGASDAWIGNGFFRKVPDAATLAKKKKAAHPVVVQDPSRPVLHRREGSEGDHPVAATVAPSPDDNDPDRPRLRRQEPSAEDKPAESSGSQAEQAAATASPAEAPEAEADHPILRRGRPQAEQGGRDLPAQGGPAGTNNPEPVWQVAVSDAGHSEPQELLFSLTEPQRVQMEASARALAQAELLRLAPKRSLNLPKATEASALALEDEQFVPYDLDYSDYATIIFSARYRSQGSGAGRGRQQSWMVTVIARQDGEKLVALYSAVSDPRALDLYPEVRLVDAVDPEGYGRYALLFREQKRDGVSWLLGRVNGYELQTLFETAAR
jgi:hypothetical protein